MNDHTDTYSSSSPLTRPASALDFPRADGPSRPQVSVEAAPAVASLQVASTHGGPGKAAPRSRSFSVATLLAAVLVLLTGWAIGVSYYFNYAGLTRLLETEERDRAERAARAVENALRLDVINLEAVVQSLHGDLSLAEALAAPVPNVQALQPVARRVRDLTTVDAVSLYDRDGRRVLYSGSPLVSRPSSPALGTTQLASATRGAVRIAFVPEHDLLTLRAQGPVLLAGSEVGSIAVERVIHANYLRDIALAAGVELGVGDAQRLLATTGSVALPHGSVEDRERVLAAGEPAFISLQGPYNVLMQPLSVLDQPLMLTVLVSKGAQRPALVQGREQLARVALLTLLAALLLGVVLTRYLIQPIRSLTERAEELALRYAGRAVQKHGNEFDSLVASFDAMTDALLGHSDRLKRAHLNELQNSLELQRQYALMRLLRGLATATNESEGVEQALQAALNEIGEYLDWPLGRIALLPDVAVGDTETPLARSLWFVRDRARYEAFIAQSESGSLIKTVHGLIGRAWISGMPHWISDLSRLTEWRRRDAALACGLHTGVVIPVTARGHVTAFIEFFADHRVEAHAEMLELIEAVGIELSRVAERHLAQQQLRGREAEARRLALVAENTEKAVMVLDTLGRVQWVNGAFTRWTGHGLDDAQGKLTHTLIRGPDTDERVIDLVARSILEGKPVKFEVVAYNRSGDRGEHEVEGRPLLDEHGAYVQYALLATDITALKQTQAALHANEVFFRAMFENSPVPIAIQDLSFRMIQCNHAYAAMLGCTPAEIEGVDPINFTHPDDRSDMQSSRTLLAGAVPPSFEFERRLVARDGRVVFVRVNGAPIQAQDGQTLLLAVVENVTDIKNNERMLREAKDVAESASRAKSQFLANMSHEIRTPMNGVLGMTELLLGTPLSDKQRRFADAVYRSGENLLGIINDILDFSKIEAGKLELEAVDFDLPTLVEDVFELLAPRAHDKRLELAHHLAHDVPRVVRGDPTRLRQVLTNLVGNAIKFTEHGEVVVDVRMAESSRAASDCNSRIADRADSAVDAAVLPIDDADSQRAAPLGTIQRNPQSSILNPQSPRIVFEVQDTGIGVKPEALDKLFSSFMQADQSMSRRYGGTGLGLAISKQLVELMGGQINVSSRYGEGSVFRFEVPLPVGDANADCMPAAPQLLAGRRVIVVEDNPTNRSILEAQLRRLDVEVATAEQGLQALELLTAAAKTGETFDAAIIDMKMPVMDGLTLAARLRRDPQLSHMGLLLLTSLTGGIEARQAHESGIDVYLAKPVRGHELVQALSSVLAGRGASMRQSPATRSFERTRVLLVEDNVVNQEVARAMLQDLGCTVGLAADGRQALAELSQAEYDLVLMDCQMPEMDGFEAVGRLRDSSRHAVPWSTAASVPVVALTANALSGDAARCLQAGFSDYLAKPFKQQQLVQVLTRWTQATGARLAADAAASQEGAAAVLPSAAATASHSAAAAVALPAAPHTAALAAPPATLAAPDTSTLDPTVLDRIRDMERRGAPDLLARLVTTYITTAARLVAQADAAAVRHESQELRHAVHTLKSASANLGASELARQCGELESMLRNGRVIAACELWPAARTEFESLVLALNAPGPETANPTAAPRSTADSAST
jgi:PAS domain S-box-containing protein